MPIWCLRAHVLQLLPSQGLNNRVWNLLSLIHGVIFALWEGTLHFRTIQEMPRIWSEKWIFLPPQAQTLSSEAAGFCAHERIHVCVCVCVCVCVWWVQGGGRFLFKTPTDTRIPYCIVHLTIFSIGMCSPFRTPAVSATAFLVTTTRIPVSAVSTHLTCPC